MHKTLAELVEAFVLCIGDAGNYLHFDKLSDRNFSFVQLLHNVEQLENPPHFSIQTKIPPDNRWDFLLNCQNYSFGNLITETNNPPQIMMSAIAIMIIALVDILFFSLCLCEIFPR